MKVHIFNFQAAYSCNGKRYKKSALESLDRVVTLILIPKPSSDFTPMVLKIVRERRYISLAAPMQPRIPAVTCNVHSPEAMCIYYLIELIRHVIVNLLLSVVSKYVLELFSPRNANVKPIATF